MYTDPNAQQPLPGEDPTSGNPGLGPGTSAYTKDEVGYRKATDSAQSCGSCVHFVRKAQQSLGLGLCDLVAGQISPNAVCDMFTAAKGIQSLK